MRPIVVLVTFYSRDGRTETLALSHAVGAVQARALIRLRRVADATPAGEFTDANDPLRRMLKEYVVPTEADVLGANAIAVAPSPGSSISSPEWASFITLLDQLGHAGKLTGKVAAVIDTGDRATTNSFASALLSSGLVVVPAADCASEATPPFATGHGRRLAETARALDSYSSRPVSR